MRITDNKKQIELLTGDHRQEKEISENLICNSRIQPACRTDATDELELRKETEGERLKRGENN